MIFDSFTIGNIKFDNRILRSSVGGRTSAYDSEVTDVWKNFEMKFATGGVGGIISTTFHVERERQAPFEYPSIAEDKFIEPLRKRIAQIKATGCKYIVQIGDPGYAMQTALFPRPRIYSLSSSNGFDLMYGHSNLRVAMTEQEIESEIDLFAKAAARVQAAGADGIEVTMEKGYIIHQFLNPGLNRRTDGWGGSPKNRFRLAAEVIKAIRKKVGDDFLVGVRLSAIDFNAYPFQNFVFRLPWVFPWRYHSIGNDIDQMLKYAQELKKLGVNFLHVTAGCGFINPKGNPGPFPYDEIRIFCNATRHLSLKAAARATLFNLIPPLIAKPLCNIGWRYEEGINLAYAETFRRETGLPVIANGGFQNLQFVESSLRDKKCDFVSMARALIANPDLVNQFKAGEKAMRPPCTHCNRCAARTATSPLGCYDRSRFASLEEMQEQIMQWNRPDP
jgi:2,4-dienoyl-CoA reductase-like NADH-dependent reductase (Old Yellow Enzyme family)